MKYLLLLLVAMIALSSCSIPVQTNTYKVKFVKTGKTMIVTSDENVATNNGLFDVGDIVDVDPLLKELKTSGSSSHAVIIQKY